MTLYVCASAVLPKLTLAIAVQLSTSAIAYFYSQVMYLWEQNNSLAVFHVPYNGHSGLFYRQLSAKQSAQSLTPF